MTAEPTLAWMDRGQAAREREALIALLADSVDSGASVGFLPPLDRAEAEAYWSSVDAAMEHTGRRLLGLWVVGELAGSIQLQRAEYPNGRHRGEVMKLIVHRRFRGRGCARMLMSAMEGEARRMGLELLVLDTLQGDVAEGMYRKLGWQEAGVIPRFARVANGELHATVVFYRILE
ncbi:MAG: GCN5-related N-acetyltransferase [Candidatus Solibacter sp.]|nr:GCN5-related N-acetyltransferase [Candidatus Solibacter sp.]